VRPERRRVPVQTTWTVTHSCGHDQDHDLSSRRPSERAGFARWLGKKECSSCWRAGRNKANSKEREAWLAERRAAEAEEIATWEQRTGMPKLDGSAKQVEWARRVRRDLLAAGHEWWLDAGRDEDEFARIEALARRITGAGWWIDQRESAPEDLAELVNDGAGENPF
jgi:hypothetical protein